MFGRTAEINGFSTVIQIKGTSGNTNITIDIDHQVDYVNKKKEVDLKRFLAERPLAHSANLIWYSN